MSIREWSLLLAILLSSCSGSVDTTIKETNYQTIFSSLLQECIDHSFMSVPGVTMTIKSPLLEETWSGAAGFSDMEQKTKAKTTHPFRIASVTKTFVAAAILRLHELDSLSIDDSIVLHIGEPFISILRSDGYQPEKMLVKHCLNHTSGLFDYAQGSSDYLTEMIKDPKRRWTRLDQLKGAMQWGDKLGEPGEQTTYCDTGYILLGLIIEKFYDGDLAKGLRQLLKFEALGLKNTWLETLEPHPNAGQFMVHRYHGKYETTDWDASIDLYGGGGLASTTGDLADFFYAIFNHEIYDNPQTIDLMLTLPDYKSAEDNNITNQIKYYNYGLWTVNAFGEQVYVHTGFWCTTTIYVPAYQASIAVNATRGTTDRLIKKVLLVLKQLKENK